MISLARSFFLSFSPYHPPFLKILQRHCFLPRFPKRAFLFCLCSEKVDKAVTFPSLCDCRSEGSDLPLTWPWKTSRGPFPSPDANQSNVNLYLAFLFKVRPRPERQDFEQEIGRCRGRHRSSHGRIHGHQVGQLCLQQRAQGRRPRPEDKLLRSLALRRGDGKRSGKPNDPRPRLARDPPVPHLFFFICLDRVRPRPPRRPARTPTTRVPAAAAAGLSRAAPRPSRTACRAKTTTMPDLVTSSTPTAAGEDKTWEVTEPPARRPRREVATRTTATPRPGGASAVTRVTEQQEAEEEDTRQIGEEKRAFLPFSLSRRRGNPGNEECLLRKRDS